MAKEASGLHYERAPTSAADERDMAMKKSLSGKAIKFSGQSSGPSSNDCAKQGTGKTGIALPVKKGRRKRGK